ncbi:zinc finger BED domain-containing protein 4-like [Microplitis demolitor]|uniref:zinc finger BED domain-containing protein 4-like n=1 Tax=Microplitis demolitor TaxID=69319 RepID=UPI0006D50465|nr:zinc finger BED domain-containing protein 4-like [Microplitis demolitor]
MDHKPFLVVEGKGFIQLMKEVVPLYKIRSRETLKKRIDETYEAMSEVFKKYIKEAEHYCITYDIWTETMQNKSLVGVTIHFLENSKLTSGSLGVFELLDKHTAEYVQKRLTDIFQQWNISIDKVTAVVTDNDSMVMKVNKDMFGEKKIIPCFSHTVNLVVMNSLDKSKVASTIISKEREIVKFIKRSVNASDELRKKQRENETKEGQIKKLILDVRTRWNSTYYMLERFMDLVSIIGTILLCRSDAPPMITSSEVGCLREIIQLLQPFERLTKEICRQNYITVSKVIPLISCVRGMLEKYSPSFESTLSLKAEIEKEVSKRFDKLEQCSSLAIATALDPRFKLIHFKDAAAKGKVINYMNNYLTNNLTNIANDSSDESEKGDNTEGDIWSYYKVLTHNNIKNKTKDKTKAETEFHMFMSSPVTLIKGDALEMWNDMKGLFPGLHNLAMIYLPIVATSVPSERLFSEAGATITQERNRLLGTRLSKLLFSNSVLKK